MLTSLVKKVKWSFSLCLFLRISEKNLKSNLVRAFESKGFYCCCWCSFFSSNAWCQKPRRRARIEGNIWQISLQRIITKKALFNKKTEYLLSVESKLIQVTAWSPWACENSNTDLPVSTSHTLITCNTEPIIIDNFTILSSLFFSFFLVGRGACHLKSSHTLNKWKLGFN